MNSRAGRIARASDTPKGQSGDEFLGPETGLADMENRHPRKISRASMGWGPLAASRTDNVTQYRPLDKTPSEHSSASPSSGD